MASGEFPNHAPTSFDESGDIQALLINNETTGYAVTLSGFACFAKRIFNTGGATRVVTIAMKSTTPNNASLSTAMLNPI